MRCSFLLCAIVTGLAGADALERDPLKQPFASNSIWNTPIGSGAQYVAANLPKVPGGNKWASMPGWDEENIILTPTAPQTPIYKSQAWDATGRTIKVGPLLANVPMPADFIVPAGPGNQCTAVLMPDGRTITQFQPLYRATTGSEALALRQFPNVDIYGPGNSGAHGGSDLSAIGGSIRVGELRPGQQGMRHALKVAVYATAELYNGATRADCYRWPATTADTNAENYYGTEGNNTNTAMKQGSLLAIPASVDIATLGLMTEPAKQLAWTLQNYGAYIDDDTWAPGFCIDIDEGSNGSFMKQFQNDYGYAFKTNCNDVNNPWMLDIQRLRQALSVVNNNSPTSIGGGGTPRQPLAAPLADPAYPIPGSLAASGAAGAVHLTWTDPSTSETGFEIWRRPLNGTWANAATVAANSTAWTDATATAGTTWQYQVRLLMASTNASKWSGLASITPVASNTAPTITAIAAQTTNEDVAKAVTFTIGDTETAAGSLVVTASSANTAVIPTAGLVLGGSGAARTLTVTPAADASGSANITVTVRDAGGLTTSRTFALTVSAVNDAPILSAISAQSATSGIAKVVAFTVDDIETAAGSLAVTASSANPAVIPATGLVLGGANGNRTLTITSASAGSANITVSVTDGGGLTTSRTFAVTVTAPPTNGLPSGWTAGDIGSVAKAGSISEAAGAWTVTGSGADIWNTADGFAFARQAVTGDVRITAKVNSVGNTNSWAKAGVMVRESTAAGSRHAFACVSRAGGVAFQRRLTTGGSSSHTAGPAVAAPYWIRLERVGNVLIGSCSANGTNWTEIRRETIAMNATLLVGLAVTAHADGALCTATFSNVEIISTASTAN